MADLKEKYGLKWNLTANDLSIELACYANHGLPGRTSDRKKSDHMINAIKLLWPERMADGQRGFVFSDWSYRRIREFCEPTYRDGDQNFITVWGPSSTGKSTDFGVIFLVDWISAPSKTTTTVCSTTSGMLQKRIWGEIIKFYLMAPQLPGDYWKSKMAILFTENDTKNGMFGIAIKKGNSNISASDIFGVHNDRNRFCVDEFQAMPETVIIGYDNISGSGDCKFVGMGNPQSWFDQLGKASTPVDGIDSVSVKDKGWPTSKGKCMFFDGLDSPGVRDPDKYSFLLSKAKIDEMRKDPGENSPRFWSQRRGFVPPDTISETVVKESHIIKFKTTGPAEFKSDIEYLAGIDPAFSTGGDKAKMKVAKTGIMTNDKFGIELVKTFDIELRLARNVPIEYYLASEVARISAEFCLKPEDIAIDTTSQQSALASILDKTLNGKVHRVDFAGNAGDTIVSNEDRRKCYEVYLNKVTELWFTTRGFIISEQIRGIDDESVKQFCSRLVFAKNKKIVIESKKDMRHRLSFSPDDADAMVALVDLAKKRNGPPVASMLDETKNDIKIERIFVDIERSSYVESDINASNDLYSVDLI